MHQLQPPSTATDKRPDLQRHGYSSPLIWPLPSHPTVPRNTTSAPSCGLISDEEGFSVVGRPATHQPQAIEALGLDDATLVHLVLCGYGPDT